MISRQRDLLRIELIDGHLLHQQEGTTNDAALCAKHQHLFVLTPSTWQANQWLKCCSLLLLKQRNSGNSQLVH